MSEFNRIVGVDASHNFPEPVRKKVFNSSESAAFKTEVVNQFKGLVDTAVENISSKKMDKVSGGRPGDILTYDGQKSVWTKPEKEVPPVGTTGHVLTKTENGVKWSSAPSPNVIWTKDLQAKAQGFWIVNSIEAPEKPFYTCEDGTVVPVIWHQPTEYLIPTIPTRPYFYPDKIKVGVEDRVGLDYYIETYTKDGVERQLNRKLLPGENDLSNVAQTPFSVKIVVKPRVGYKLPSEFVWTMHYYDPNTAVLFGTETFDDKPTNSFLVNRQFGDSGGYWIYNNGENSKFNFPVPEPSTYYDRGVGMTHDGNGASAKVQNGKLQLTSQTRWGAIGVETRSDKMKLTFDITRVPNRTDSEFTVSLSSSVNSIIQGIPFTFYMNRGIRNDRTGQMLTATRPTVGTYMLESLGDNISLTMPSGEKITRSIDPGVIDQLKNTNMYGPAFCFRINTGKIDANDPFEIDNVSVTNYGV